MKKTLICIGAMVLLFSCSNSPVDNVASDFCDCTQEKPGSTMDDCFDEWEKQYTGIEITEQEITDGETYVKECSSGLSATRFRLRIQKMKK